MLSDAAAMTLVGADRGRGGGGIVLCNWRKWFSPSVALMQFVLIDNIVNLQMEVNRLVLGSVQYPSLRCGSS